MRLNIILCYAAACRDKIKLVQIRSETQLVQYSSVMQLRSNLWRQGVEHSSYNIHGSYHIDLLCKQYTDVVELVQTKGGAQYVIHLLCNLCRWGQTLSVRGGTEHTLILLCNMKVHEVKLVRIRSGIQCINTLLYSLWRRDRTCADEEWNTEQDS